MIHYNGYVYSVDTIFIDSAIMTCSFTAKKYSSEFNAENDVDQISILYYVYRGQDYFIEEGDDIDYVVEEKLRSNLLSGLEDVGVTFGKGMTIIEKELSKKRVEIGKLIDSATNNTIENGFRFSLSPDTPVKATLEWQFDVQNLYLSREIIQFPYRLKTSVDNNSKNLYIELDNSGILSLLYMEMFSHIASALDKGRTDKDALYHMSKEEIENYEYTL
jgi:hypothetical protein